MKWAEVVDVAAIATTGAFRFNVAVLPESNIPRDIDASIHGIDLFLLRMHIPDQSERRIRSKTNAGLDPSDRCRPLSHRTAAGVSRPRVRAMCFSAEERWQEQEQR